MLDGVESVAHVFTTRPVISMRNVEVDCKGEISVYPANVPGSFRISPTPSVAGPSPLLIGRFCANVMQKAENTKTDAAKKIARRLLFISAPSLKAYRRSFQVPVSTF